MFSWKYWTSFSFWISSPRGKASSFAICSFLFNCLILLHRCSPRRWRLAHFIRPSWNISTLKYEWSFFENDVFDNKDIEILNPQERIRLYDTAGIDENTKVCHHMNNCYFIMKGCYRFFLSHSLSQFQYKFLGLPDPDTLVRGTDPAQDPAPSLIKQK